LITLGSFLNREVALIFWVAFFHSKKYVTLKKVDWAEFWAIFSQTHQVALVLASFS
jgi:hypothetical protein